MCAQGPPSYSELETNDRDRLRREAALAQVSQDATYCVHYSSLREILNSRDLADQIARYPEGDCQGRRQNIPLWRRESVPPR